MSESWFVRNEGALLREWDRIWSRVGGLLLERFGETSAATLRVEARCVFDTLIPRLPDVGPSRMLRRFVSATGWYLALWRVLQRRGWSVERAGRLLWEISVCYLDSVPGFLKRLFRRVTLSRRGIAGVRRAAARSRATARPGGYVFDLVEGDGFLYGIDYRECAALKFLRAEGAAELAPYICPVDVAYSTALGWGLKRTMTLADGAERCDFRFRPGSRTEVAVPEAVGDLVAARLQQERL